MVATHLELFCFKLKRLRFHEMVVIVLSVYLFLGLIMMMLVLANIYDVPELNVGFHFYMRSDDEEQERLRLRSSDDQTGPKYTQQVDDTQNMSQSATSVSRGDDDEQQLTPAQQ